MGWDGIYWCAGPSLAHFPLPARISMQNKTKGYITILSEAKDSYITPLFYSIIYYYILQGNTFLTTLDKILTHLGQNFNTGRQIFNTSFIRQFISSPK